MIHLINLQKTYPVAKKRFMALQNINLEIKPGEMVAIQGKSGAGKTTLLNIIGCLDDFDKGDYLFNGQSIAKKKDKELASIRSTQIGFVFQDYALINQQSVLFNTMLPMFFDSTKYSDMKSKAENALAQVGLLKEKNKKANHLSGGQRQRVAIARAIVNKPKLILADEPTGALDSVTAKEIMALLTELNKAGLTVLVVTHDNDVAAYCRRHIEIHDGQIIKDSQTT